MLTKIKVNYYIVLYLLSFYLMFYSYNYQIEHPPCCDVYGYIALANHYLEHGLFSNYSLSGIRLYGFPLYLATLSKLFSPEFLLIAYSIINIILYVTFSFLITSQLAKYIKSDFLHIAFSLNIFLFPYLVVVLADGLSIILWMIIFYLILKILDIEKKNNFFVFLFLCSFVIGFSVMVRPSNLSLVTILPLLFVGMYILKKQLNLFIVFLVLLTGFLIAVLPQLYINLTIFNKITFLPADSLGDSQIAWGIQYIKYATNLSGYEIPQLYYSNPFYLSSDKLDIFWYFTNISNGIKTLFLHIFNVFTYDYYFPYVYDLYPKYKSITLIYSWFILYFGVIGFFDSLICFIKNKSFDKVLDNNLKFLYILYLLIFIFTLIILSISAVEVRFSLPLVFMLLPFSFYALFKFKSNLKVMSVFFLWILFAYTLNSFVELQKNIPFFQGM